MLSRPQDAAEQRPRLHDVHRSSLNRAVKIGRLESTRFSYRSASVFSAEQ